MKVNWHGAAELTRFHFRDMYREKVALFFNLFFPLILVTIFGSIFGVPDPETGVRPAGVFEYLMPGQLVVMLLSAGLVTVGISLASQRQSGALRHLFSTPLSVGAWTTARVAANLVMAVLQCVILFAFAGLVFDVPPPADLAGTLVILILSTLACLAMGLAVGVFVQGEAAALTATMPLFMILLFLGNAAMPLENPPRFIEVLLPFIPTRYMTGALRQVMMEQSGLGAVVPEMLVLAAVAAVLFALAVWRMRRQFVVA